MQRTDEKFGTRGSRIAWTALTAVIAVLAFVLPSYIGQAGESARGGQNFELLCARLAEPAQDEYVYLGGIPIGISIGADGLMVQGQSAVSTADGSAYPAKESGISKGDILLKINGESINSLYGLKKTLEKSEGELSLTILRNGARIETKITPAEDISGQKRLGLILKEDVGGVGTLTFVTKSGRFGALGHYIADAETGLGEELQSGRIYPTTVEGVIKGEAGKAGGLQADVNRLFKPLGKIDTNALIGIYGDYAGAPGGELVKVAKKGEAKMGAAQVLTTIEGSEPQYYDIDIVKVVSQSDVGEKGMVIAVRDKRLLDNAGGIVQGMSGSPIVQNGMFIGAVTHVFVQDPTRGYAVHGRFMLEQAIFSGELQDAA